jgi:DNA polymerase-1
MIVGEAPGEQETRMKTPFCGPSGDEIFNLLYRFAYLSRRDVYVTNTFHWPMEVPESRLTRGEWIAARSTLASEIAIVKPKVILALGAVATHALLPSTIAHDMETVNAIPHYYKDTSIIVVPSYHPAASFRDSSKLQYCVDAMKCVNEVLNGRRGVTQIVPIATRITGVESQVDSPIVALDTETLSITNNPYIVGVSSHVGEAALAYVDNDPLPLIKIARHVSQPWVTTLLHNAMFDLPVLEQLSIYPYRWVDTMNEAFMIQYLPLSLKELSYRLLGLEMRTYEDVVLKQGCRDLSEVAVADREQYAASDPNATLQIHNVMKPMCYRGMRQVLRLDMDIQPMVVEMMRRGIGVDRKHLADMDEELGAQNYVRLLKIQKIAAKYGFTVPMKSGANKGMTFNPRSSKQLEELFYKKLKLGKGKRIKRTSTGSLSTSKKVMALIKEEHPVIQIISEYKETATLQTSFLKQLQKHIRDDGRIHADFSMTRIPHSGRFAVSKPNLLAIPVRSDNGRKIREGFVASDGYSFVSGDLSQIELRCLAHNSQDTEMLNVYNNDKDIHANTAMRIFKITNPSLIDDYRHRLPSKTCNFLICNLGTAAALSRELISAGAGYEWTVDRCQDMIDSWFGAYPGVRKYLDGVGRLAFTQGFIVDMFGRREVLPQFYSSNERTREEGVRIACNQQIQAGAQGIIKTVMRNVWVKSGREWMEKGIAYPLIQLHDDYLIECRDDMIDDVVPVIRYEMENSVPWLTVPVKVGMKVGKVWGSMTKVGE